MELYLKVCNLIAFWAKQRGKENAQYRSQVERYRQFNEADLIRLRAL
jgi:adenylate cyclase